MPRYEIEWQTFGVLYDVEAKDEDEAKEILDDELFSGPLYDGLDYTITEV